ncbi:MAG TPA: zf-HC2 domain-containing protein [Pyrinomonadaceae bacterium]|nr:zf-HC2 domain-containing protein [Pyrinomonadaceae bacterium]
MRCVDCRAVIEDYFDGELEPETAARVAAHLPACAECASALEALEAEQAVYLRYDRGLEVTPALWEGVRASLARAAEAAETAETAAPPARPVTAPRAGLRALLASIFAAPILRPALASSLALLVFAAVAGSLFFKSTETRAPAPPIAENGAAPRTGDARTARVESPAAPIEGGDPDSAGASAAVNAPDGPAEVAVSTASRDASAAGLTAATAGRLSRGGATPPGAPPPGPGSLGAPPTVASAGGPAAAPPDPDHLEVAGGELLPLVSTASLESAEFSEESERIAAGAARLLDPEEKEVARHVERAQLLLRSFRNTRAAERTGAEVAYERELSRRLLEENVALRAEAEAAGDKATGRVLEAIQPFLLDIANMRETPSRQEVRSIKERMRKTEIVAALQVY